MGTFDAEYVIRDGDLIVHLYRRDGDEKFFWFKDDPVTLRQAFLMIFRLDGREEQLQVELVPELYSWCVIVRQVAGLHLPSRDTIWRTLDLFERARTSRGGPE